MSKYSSYGKPLSEKMLDGLIDKLNAADDAAQAWIDSHRGGEVDDETEALYEATYELCAWLQDIVRYNLAPQVRGLIDLSEAYK